MAWVGVLVVVFWYPFDFHTDGAFIRERMGFLSKVPFETYYYGTEFRAVTEVFHKLLFLAPLGFFLAWFVARVPWRWRTAAGLAAFLTILAVPLGIELGQVLLPDKFPDTADWVLEGLGGLAGYLFLGIFRPRLAGAVGPRPGSTPPRRRGA
jgi:glycopeptide antibiotics resistance protein